MKLIAKKPCSFGGRRFLINDEIPEELVLDASAQEKMGVVAIVPETGAALEDCVAKVGEVLFSVPVRKGDETFELDISEPQIRETVEIMQMTQKDATAHIKGHVGDNTVLILINAMDSRTAVKKEAEIKVKTLAETEERTGDA